MEICEETINREEHSFFHDMYNRIQKSKAEDDTSERIKCMKELNEEYFLGLGKDDETGEIEEKIKTSMVIEASEGEICMEYIDPRYGGLPKNCKIVIKEDEAYKIVYYDEKESEGGKTSNHNEKENNESTVSNHNRREILFKNTFNRITEEERMARSKFEYLLSQYGLEDGIKYTDEKGVDIQIISTDIRPREKEDNEGNILRDVSGGGKQIIISRKKDPDINEKTYLFMMNNGKFRKGESRKLGMYEQHTLKGNEIINEIENVNLTITEAIKYIEDKQKDGEVDLLVNSL